MPKPLYGVHLIAAGSFALYRWAKMRDRIMNLCSKLVRVEDPDEVRPVANQLKQAIRERVESVRESTVELAILDRLVDGDAFCADISFPGRGVQS